MSGAGVGFLCAPGSGVSENPLQTLRRSLDNLPPKVGGTGESSPLACREAASRIHFAPADFLLRIPAVSRATGRDRQPCRRASLQSGSSSGNRGFGIGPHSLLRQRSCRPKTRTISSTCSSWRCDDSGLQDKKAPEFADRGTYSISGFADAKCDYMEF